MTTAETEPEPDQQATDELEQRLQIIRQEDTYRWINFGKHALQPSRCERSPEVGARKSFYRDLMTVLTDSTCNVLLKVPNRDVLADKVEILRRLADNAPDEPTPAMLSTNDWHNDFVSFLREMMVDWDPAGARQQRDEWLTSTEWDNIDAYYQAVDQADWSVASLVDRLQDVAGNTTDPTTTTTTATDPHPPPITGGDDTQSELSSPRHHPDRTITPHPDSVRTQGTNQDINLSPNGRGQSGTSNSAPPGNGPPLFHPQASMQDLNKIDFREAVQHELAPYIKAGEKVPDVQKQTLSLQMAREIRYFQWAPHDFDEEWSVLFDQPSDHQYFNENVRRAMEYGQIALHKARIMNNEGLRLKTWTPWFKKRCKSMVETINMAKMYPIHEPIVMTRPPQTSAYLMPPAKRSRNNDGSATNRTADGARLPLQQLRNQTNTRVTAQLHPAPGPFQPQRGAARSLQELMKESVATGPEFAAAALGAYGVDRDAKLTPFVQRVAQVITNEQTAPLAQRMLDMLNDKGTNDKQKVYKIQGTISLHFSTHFPLFFFSKFLSPFFPLFLFSFSQNFYMIPITLTPLSLQKQPSFPLINE